MLEQVLEHERAGTARIDEILRQGSAENDHATEVEVQWFVNEQVKEEKSASRILARLKMAGDDPAALMMVGGALDE